MAPSTAPQLPIHAHEEEIVAAVRANPVVVVIAETGSGKTTQIAKMLYNAGFAEHGTIGITQPRRVAAVSVARRVSEEMDVELGELVGYAVRFEERTSSRTRIKYLTDGTLLRELLEDAQLLKYSCLILDEAHERSLNTDILLGVLKTLVKQRTPPLKLVITSATLEGEKFSAHFYNAPVLQVPGRCFEVQLIHATEDHDRDYLSTAVDTVLQIHTTQPPGDILLFLTGQAEIDKAVKQINDAVSSLSEEEAGPLAVLPLYAALPPELQIRIFSTCAPDTRRCIVATNIAETSVTVPGVVYVVDAGVVKQKEYNPVTGMDSLDVVPISKVQATQRAGRAGRTAPGKCFRLYTRRYFDMKMADITVPEIQRMSLVGAVLHLKSLQLDIDVLNFDFLDPPAREQIEDALRQLYVLDAIDADGHITPIGRRMTHLPLDPSLCRALLAAQELGCLEEAMTVIAMLSVETLFTGNRGPVQLCQPPKEGSDAHTAAHGGVRSPPRPLSDRGRTILQQLMREGLGDHVFYLRLYQAWEMSDYSSDFCKTIGVEMRGMRFARDVRRQIARIVQGGGARGGDREGGGGPPAAKKARHEQQTVSGSTSAVRQCLLIGLATRLAYRLPRANGYKTMGRTTTLAQLHPTTAHVGVDEDGLLPKWVVYNELISTSSVFLSKVCVVEGKWVDMLLPKLQHVDVQRLSGGRLHDKEEASGLGDNTTAQAGAEQGDDKAPAAGGERRNDDEALAAARQRYLARKAAAVKQGKAGGKR